MESVRKFDASRLRHNIPAAPPPPPLLSSIGNPMEQYSSSNYGPPKTDFQYIKEDIKPSFTNFVTTGSPYLQVTSYPGSSMTGGYSQPDKTSISLPEGNDMEQKHGTVPPPPPLPHLPIRRQPSALLHEIRGGKSKKRLSGHNLGVYGRLRHVETVEKRAFPIGRVIDHPVHVTTTQELIRSFNKRLLNRIPFDEPPPAYPVGEVVTSARFHVPKMKAKFSPTKKSPTAGFSKKRAPGKLKKSAVTAPEDKLPQIPTPPPIHDNVQEPVHTKQQMSKKSPTSIKPSKKW